MMNNLAVLELEALLLQIKESHSARESGLIRQFLEKLCTDIGSSSTRSPQKILFDQNNSGQQRKFIAVSLLRLLCADESAIGEPLDFRNHVFEFFDEEISESYKSLGIELDDDNNKKLIRLRDAENMVHEAFAIITNSVNSLQTAVEIRNRFMHNLNYSLNKLFLDQFVDPSLISKERIKEIFSALAQYEKSSTLSRLECYKNLQSIFSTYFIDAEKSRSIISLRCIIGPLQKIKDIVDKDFRENDAIKPTSVSLFSPNRKYPFHIVGKKTIIKALLQVHGLGHAFDTRIEISDSDDGLEILNPSIYLGSLRPGKIEVAFEAIVRKAINYAPPLVGSFSWSNYNGPTNTKDFMLELTPQRSDIDWETLRTSKPYSLEAVKTEEELVGRSELLQILFSKLTSLQLESTIVYGQKRVGKTSIAKTLQSKLRKEQNYSVIYIFVGSLNKLSSSIFVTTLGEKIVREIRFDSALLHLNLETPQFNGALAPLSDYFENIKRIKPDHRFLIIIDEFDEIPHELFNYTPIGDTFFHNIRSFSSEGQIGFVLVGGENMRLIQQSTDRLNKFDAFRVDYFEKENYWNDFQELIRKPCKDSVEFSDEAIVALYDMTEGNPFYTKFICTKIFEKACDSRSSFISQDEVDSAVKKCVDSLELNQVNHFWKDGILHNDPARRDQIETQRRKFLIAFAEIMRAKGEI